MNALSGVTTTKADATRTAVGMEARAVGEASEATETAGHAGEEDDTKNLRFSGNLAVPGTCSPFSTHSDLFLH